MIFMCRPNAFVLLETKLATLDVTFFRTFLGSGPIDFAFSPSNDLSGGLLSIWDPSVILWYILDLSFHFIVVNFCGSDGFQWSLTNVYGLNDLGEKVLAKVVKSSRAIVMPHRWLGFFMSSKLKLLKNNLKHWCRTKFSNLAENMGRLE
ncbi:hypothetical protein AMTRI_Chr06g174680 [Amborella trichopoda]